MTKAFSGVVLSLLNPKCRLAMQFDRGYDVDGHLQRWLGDLCEIHCV